MDFPFPYVPYKQQKELMQAMYDCISSGKVGLFESPTGIDSIDASILNFTHPWFIRHGEVIVHHLQRIVLAEE